MEWQGKIYFRWGTTATPTGETAHSPAYPCSQATVDYLMAAPLYEKSWYEVRGGPYGGEWRKVEDLIKEAAGVP
jgi:hypothetical protein